MKLFEKFFINREIEDWRVNQTLSATRVLNQTAADLINLFEAQLDTADWKDCLINQNDFLATHISPVMEDKSETIVRLIVDEANTALKELKAHHIIWTRQTSSGLEGVSQFEGLSDIAIGVGPLAGGGALAIALPAVAVTTTTAWLGLATTSAISWPLLIGGGAIAGVGVATGAINTAKIKAKAKDRLRKRIKALVLKYLLKGSDTYPSILEQLSAEFQSASEKAKAL